MRCSQVNKTAGSKLLIGIDAGGTKTRAVLAECRAEQIVEIGAGLAGPGNVRSAGIATTISNIASAIQDAFKSTSRPTGFADAACLCVAGAGRDEERELIASAAVQAQLASKIRVVSDADVLFASANAEGGRSCDESPCEYICLIAGTGSIAIGRDAQGKTLRCGGWGYLLGDQGSGFAIGQAALALIAQAADGLVSESQLTAAVLQQLNLSTPQELIGWCYSGSDARGRIASLAPVVFECKTDEAAARIIASAANALARQACNVANRLSLSRPKLVCGGSLLVKQPTFLKQVEHALNAGGVVLQGVCVVERPELGALEIARQL